MAGQRQGRASVRGNEGGQSLDRAPSGYPKQLVFSIQEYEERISSLRKQMRERRLDVLLVHQPPSVFYLSGSENLHVYDSECVIVLLDGELSLVVPDGELARAKLTTWFERVFGWPRGTNSADTVARILVDHGLDSARIGVEKQVARAAGLSVYTYEGLLAALPRAEIVDGSGVVEKVKLIKSPKEIELIRRAAVLTDYGVRAAVEAASEGRMDYEVAAAAYSALVTAGSEYMSIPPVVAVGAGTSVSHSNHKRVRICKGDLITVEFGACYERYTAPCARTISIGQPSAEVRRAADVCIAALDAVIATLTPGATFDEVAQAGAEVLQTAGPGFDIHDYFGYTVGVGFPPHWGDYCAVIRPGKRTRLQPGMVFHHPIVLRVPGSYGFMVSETTQVTESGCEVLTGIERRLFVR